MATIYRTDGSTDTVTPETESFTLHEAQAIIGGLLEIVRLEEDFLIVDEEGLLKGLPINPQATMLAKRMIVGTALLTNDEEFN